MADDRQTKHALADIAELAYLLRPVADARQWCDGLGYRKRVLADPGPRSSDHHDNGDTLCSCATEPPAEGELIGMCGPCKARSSLELADKLLAEAKNNYVGALGLLDDALKASDRGHAPRPAEYQVTAARAVSKAELRQAAKARDRRQNRGQGHG